MGMMERHYQPFYDTLLGPAQFSSSGGIIYNTPIVAPSMQPLTLAPMVAQMPMTSSVVHATPFVNPVT